MARKKKEIIEEVQNEAIAPKNDKLSKEELLQMANERLELQVMDLEVQLKNKEINEKSLTITIEQLKQQVQSFQNLQKIETINKAMDSCKNELETLKKKKTTIEEKIIETNKQIAIAHNIEGAWAHDPRNGKIVLIEDK